jgi:hypothetical protein
VKVLFRFLGQRPSLDVWEQAPFTPGVEAGPRPGDRRDHYEREVAREAPGLPEPGGPCERLAGAIRRYDIFPPSLITGLVRRPVEVGDTFGTCYHFLPGIDLFFAGRVTEVFAGEDGQTWQAGFTFRTVRGHPELGEETFFVKKDLGSGAVHAGMRSWSRPGLWLTRLAGPFTRRVQVRSSHAGLEHFAQVARG